MSDVNHHQQPVFPLMYYVTVAYKITFANIKDITKLTWAWIIVLLIAAPLVHLLLLPLKGPPGGDPTTIATIATYVESLLPTLISTSIAVGWHRRLLINEPIASASNLRLDELVWRYFAWAIVLGLATGILRFAAGIILSPIPFVETSTISWTIATTAKAIILVGIYFCAARISVLFPGISLGHKVSILETWHRTRGNGFRILIGFVLTSLPVQFVLFLLLIYLQFGLLTVPVGFQLELFLIQPMIVVAAIVNYSFLAITYRHFFGSIQPKTAQTTTAR